MRLKQLKLRNFRNYNEVSLDFCKGINIFIGNNGSGKTNILEAIYVLSLTKSNRYGTDYDLIKSGESFFSIIGMIDYDEYLKQYEIQVDKLSKKVFMNATHIKKISSYIGQFCVVSFLPHDIEIIKGSPSHRRSVLNIQIGVLYNQYLKYLNEYNNLLKIRNEYLKKLNLNSVADSRYLEIINQKMIDLNAKIYAYRFSYFEQINKILPQIFKKLSGISSVFLKYENSLNLSSYDENLIIESLKEKYQKNYFKELQQGMTLTGVHRDDFWFSIEGMDAKIFASQGQQRLLVIAYKIAELLIFKKIKNEYPVLLLDDVFSEIDIKRRNNIIKYLKGDLQVIITTTDLEEIYEELTENAKIFQIKNGEIKVKGGGKNARRKSSRKL